LEPEITHVAWPFVDNCSIKGPASRYEDGDYGYETLADNPGIRKFVWQHLLDVHCILHCLHCAGATVSAKKLFIAVPEVIILGHKCNYKGCIPDDSKIACVWDWLACKNLTDIRAFLGTTGFMQIWIKNYSALAQPLVHLTHKGQPFIWAEEQDQAMQALKEVIIHSLALISIDYSSDLSVYVGIDASPLGVGWILCRDCPDGKCHPAHFGSISWNECKAQYSQPKRELYGLFRALRALHVHIIGVHSLVVEMDAQFIRGMIQNPDIQPNTTINHWIAAILLFDFKLVYIPTDKHHGPDGLSRCLPAEGEEEEEDPEEWIDHMLSLGLWVHTWLDMPRYVQILSLTQAPSSDSSSSEEPWKFPVSKKALQAKEDLMHLQFYLHSLRLPLGLSKKGSARLLRVAAHFFLLNGQLWRQQGQGWHQVYIPPPQRHDIIHETHDHLGHKGFYSTR
jgi:reverse transcriptase-like protein